MAVLGNYAVCSVYSGVGRDSPGHFQAMVVVDFNQSVPRALSLYSKAAYVVVCCSVVQKFFCGLCLS